MSPFIMTRLLSFLTFIHLVTAQCIEVPPPAGTLCNVPARARTGINFLAGTSIGQPVQSARDCADFCSKSAGCTGFYFSPLGTSFTICQLFTGTTAETVNEQPTSPFSIFDLVCFNCTTQPPVIPPSPEVTPIIVPSPNSPSNTTQPAGTANPTNNLPRPSGYSGPTNICPTCGGGVSGGTSPGNPIIAPIQFTGAACSSKSVASLMVPLIAVYLTW